MHDYMWSSLTIIIIIVIFARRKRRKEEKKKHLSLDPPYNCVRADNKLRL